MPASVQPPALTKSTLEYVVRELNVELAGKPEMRDWWRGEEAVPLQRLLVQNAPRAHMH